MGGNVGSGSLTLLRQEAGWEDPPHRGEHGEIGVRGTQGGPSPGASISSSVEASARSAWAEESRARPIG